MPGTTALFLPSRPQEGRVPGTTGLFLPSRQREGPGVGTARRTLSILPPWGRCPQGGGGAPGPNSPKAKNQPPAGRGTAPAPERFWVCFVTAIGPIELGQFMIASTMYSRCECTERGTPGRFTIQLDRHCS